MHDEPIELLRKKIKLLLSDGWMFHTAANELNDLLDAIEREYVVTNKANVSVQESGYDGCSYVSF